MKPGNSYKFLSIENSKVENTIRWRYEKDSEGNDIKRSNARLVKWSDGRYYTNFDNIFIPIRLFIDIFFHFLSKLIDVFRK